MSEITDEIEEPEIEQEPEILDSETQETEAEEIPAEETVKSEETEDSESQKDEEDQLDGELKEELEEEGFVVTLEGEEPEKPEDITQEKESDSSILKKLRKLVKAKDRELREFKSEQKSASENKEELIELGKKPDLWDEQIDGDAEKHSEALIAWKERKRQIEAREEEKQKLRKSEEEAFEAKRESYRQRAASLKAPDFEEVEMIAAEALDQVTQSLIVDQAKEPEKVVYAVGKREDIRKQFQSVSGNPVQKALQVGRILERLEKSMSITPKRKTPKAEPTVKGHSSSTGSYEAMLAKAEKEAEKTGDRSNVIKLKRERLKKQT